MRVGSLYTRLLGFAAIAIVCSIIACSGGPSVAPGPVQGGAPQVAPSPTITSFAAAPSRIQAGESAQLVAVFQHGQGMVQPGNLSVQSGVPLTVTPTVTTTYTLTVSQPGGSSFQAQAQVEVLPPTNLAQGKPVQVWPGIGGQATSFTALLTDGEQAKDHFFSTASALGWWGTPVEFRLDLGKVQTVSAIGFSTAAGDSDVEWPERIWALASTDGQAWFPITDLMTDQGKLPSGYIKRWLRAGFNPTQARYIHLFTQPRLNSYIFTDEIQVLGAEASASQGTSTASARPYLDPVTDIRAFIARVSLEDRFRSWFTRLLSAAKEDLPLVTSPTQRAEHAAAWEQLNAEVARFQTDQPLDRYRGTLPLAPLERRIGELQAAIWRGQGKEPLRVWTSGRWDFLAPAAEPTQEGAASLDLLVMNRERRGTVLNLTNASAEDLDITLTLDSLPGKPHAQQARIHKVVSVATWYADPLPYILESLPLVAGRSTLRIRPGSTEQVWLSLQPEGAPAGTHQAQIGLHAPALNWTRNLPWRIEIPGTIFPERPTLKTSGWDYVHAEGIWGLTPQNVPALVDYLKEHQVNIPWAQGWLLAEGLGLDENGAVTQADTRSCDAWLARFPDAPIYLFAMGRMNFLDAFPLGSEAFGNRLGSWIRFWVGHFQKRGIAPSRIGLLLQDEPRTPAHLAWISECARVIRQVAPEVRIWENPTPFNPAELSEAMEVSHILSPLRSGLIHHQAWMEPLFMQAKAKGKELWLYSCSGPAPLLDPARYYLGQAWHAFQLGASGSTFWSFTDTPRYHWSQDLMPTAQYNFGPAALHPGGVDHTRQMEALREGIQDFEYLSLLQRKVQVRSQAQGETPAIQEARALLASAPISFLRGETGRAWEWVPGKATGRDQDALRHQIVDQLERLQGP